MRTTAARNGGPLRTLSLAVALVACGAPAAAVPDASTVPLTITITSDEFDAAGPGARLADGTVLPAGMGDLWLAQRSTVSIFAAAPIGICDVGSFAALSSVPTDASACLGAPNDSIVLGGNANGTDAWAGRAFLVFPDTTFDHAPTHRARIVTDAVVNPHVTMTFELERLR